MKRWAIVTVSLYVLVLLAVLGPVVVASFVLGDPHDKMLEGLAEIYSGSPGWIIWAWAGGMGLLQAALLVVPVRLAGERPVARRHVFWTFLAMALLIVILAGAMCLAVWETITNTKWLRDNEMWGFWGVVAVAGLWMIWGIVWAFYAGGKEPRTLMQRFTRTLLAGSILELLVAVPTHILARARNYCCAGLFTVWGLAAGVSIMLLAFGPGVFLLFARRYRSLKHRRTKDSAPTSILPPAARN